MPRTVEWIHRLTEIKEILCATPDAFLDRAAIQNIFHLSSRQSNRILKKMGASQAGGAMRLNLANDVHYRVVRNRLAASGKTLDNSPELFNRIGTELQHHDPHHRLLGIHDDNGTLPNAFYGKASRWNTLGQYGQYSGSDYEWPWCDGCTPPDDAHCQGRVATPKNRQTLHGFFTQRANGSRRAWWQLVPHDELVSSRPNPGDGSPGYAYCLADPGQSYIVYTENTKSTDLVLSGSANATYRVTRFDPRTAHRTLVKTSVKNGTTITLLSPDTEDWAYEVQKN